MGGLQRDKRVSGAKSSSDDVAADAQLTVVALNRETDDMDRISERAELRGHECRSFDCEAIKLRSGAFEVGVDAGRDVE
ncbi:hypothetical protein [Tsukamurella sp. PLM1]|uniref:hypothetical protein n=1 Tax=Tsukamurella sp. PLM1 TaxID=2929795 RepID=UPI0020C023BB|nr:hypothetical protein [Tsukamurella sp. PLM1]